MEPLFGLAINLPPHGSRNRLRMLYHQLRTAIIDGRLKPGMRLPATRKLAAQLGIARNTAVAAYDLLLSEGYLEIRPGSGAYVANFATKQTRQKSLFNQPTTDNRLNELWRDPPSFLAGPRHDSITYDFSVGLPDQTSFPFDVWRRLSTRTLRGLSKVPATYAEPEGRPALREAITGHISYARAVSCQPENIVVTAGAQQAFNLLSRILVTPKQTVVAIEEPGYPPLRAVLALAGADIVTIPVDDEGMKVEHLPERTRVICVTPSHQFPLGVTLSARRRAALLDFAQSHSAVIIEDDYDGEFRLNGQPHDALQTLDRSESVFYVGTFSKSLFPALRLGFVVSPPWATRSLIAAKLHSDWHCAVLGQDTLAAFIEEGHLVRHVRKMDKIYADRRQSLLQSLARHCGDTLRPIGADVGLHLAAELFPPARPGDLAKTAATRGIRLQSIDRYAIDRSTANGLVLGYGMIQAEQIDAGICRLATAMDNGD